MTKAIPTYLVSDHEWLSVKVLAEKDARIAELEAENERLTEALGKCTGQRAELVQRITDIYEAAPIDATKIEGALFSLYLVAKGQGKS